MRSIREVIIKQPERLIRTSLVAVVLLTLIAIFVLNASKTGRVAEGCPEGCATAIKRHPGPLRVISLNMLHGFPWFKDLQLRLNLIASEIKRLDADVILLQEVPWTIQTGNAAEELARQIGYNYLYYRANGNKSLIFFEEGEAVLSRFPLKQPVYTELQPRAGFFESRVSLGSTAVTPWGEITFFVAHLTDKDPKVAEGQAKALQHFVGTHANGMAVIAGDFNSLEDSPQIKELAGLWIDTYRVAHPDDPGLTCCIDDLNSAPGEALEKRIDYIFVANLSGKLINSEHAFYQPYPINDGWQWASDHTGLMVEIIP
jgi:endonuclease/exonuclease/phosphatase family metal-dependent hydrolase